MAKVELRTKMRRKRFLSRLAAPERGRLALVYARELVMHLCGDAIHATRAPPPHLLQRIGERPALEAPRLLMRKLADGEVCLLLAGARSTEGYAQDLNLCAAGARTLRPASHVARSRHRLRLCQGSTSTK